MIRNSKQSTSIDIFSSVKSRHQFVRNVSGHLATETKLWWDGHSEQSSSKVTSAVSWWKKNIKGKEPTMNQPFIKLTWSLKFFCLRCFWDSKPRWYHAIDGTAGVKGSNLEQLRTSMLTGENVIKFWSAPTWKNLKSLSKHLMWIIYPAAN